MEDQEQPKSSRVAKVDSADSWNFYVTQAKTQGCPRKILATFLSTHEPPQPDCVTLNIRTTIQSISNVEDSETIVAHFTASWCIPSLFMNSFFEDLASSYKDVLFLIVDVDEVKDVATRLEVKAMPTFIFLKDGNTMDKLVGANPDEIKKRVDGFVQSSRLIHIA